MVQVQVTPPPFLPLPPLGGPFFPRERTESDALVAEAPATPTDHQTEQTRFSLSPGSLLPFALCLALSAQENLNWSYQVEPSGGTRNPLGAWMFPIQIQKSDTGLDLWGEWGKISALTFRNSEREGLNHRGNCWLEIKVIRGDGVWGSEENFWHTFSNLS